MGVHWILSWVQNRFCTHVSTTSCIRSLASEFCARRSAFADAAAQLVACVIGGASSAFGGAIAESRSAADDFKLVCQQLLRSSNRRRLDAVPGGRAHSLHDPSHRGPFLPLRGIHWSVSVLVFRRRVCGMESLGAGRLLGADPDTTFFKCARGINNRAVDRNVGDEWSSGPAKARLSRYLEACALFLGLLAVSYAVLYELRSGADLALLFLPLPFLIWAAVRFGTLGASTAISIVGFLAIWSASHGHGPFSGETPEQNALSIQIFLIVLAIPLLFLATVIEERVTGKTELLESESRFRIVADAAPVLIWMAGVDKLCTFFNKPWLDFTGRSTEQELGNGWAEGVHRDDLQKCLAVYTQAFDARQPFVMQYRLRRNDGEYRWISDQGVPRYDAQGKFAGYIGSCVDVTELMTKDEALRQSEERMRLAAAAVNLGIWEWDLSKDEIWATNARRGLLGSPAPGKIALEDFLCRLHPDDRDRVRHINRRCHSKRCRF